MVFGIDQKKIMLKTIVGLLKTKLNENPKEPFIIELKEVRDYIEKELPEFSVSIKEKGHDKELHDVSIKLGLKK